MIKIGENLKVNNDPLCINFKSNRYILIYLIKEPNYNFVEIEYNYSEKEFENNSNNNIIEKIGIEIENLTDKEIESEIENIICFIKEKYNEKI